MGRDGAGIAFVVAGPCWELVEEVCFGIAVGIEGCCRVGDWSSNRVVLVVDVEGLIACVAVGKRGFGLPVSMGLRSASARGAENSKIYLFWLCVTDRRI